jgi:hypothetical protein
MLWSSLLKDLFWGFVRFSQNFSTLFLTMFLIPCFQAYISGKKDVMPTNPLPQRRHILTSFCNVYWSQGSPQMWVQQVKVFSQQVNHRRGFIDLQAWSATMGNKDNRINLNINWIDNVVRVPWSVDTVRIVLNPTIKICNVHTPKMSRLINLQIYYYLAIVYYYSLLNLSKL